MKDDRPWNQGDRGPRPTQGQGCAQIVGVALAAFAVLMIVATVAVALTEEHPAPGIVVGLLLAGVSGVSATVCLILSRPRR